VRLLRAPDGTRAVLKDYFHVDPLYRATVARFAIGNEARAYETLRGLTGIPTFYGRPTPDSLLVEFVDGTEVCRLTPGDLPWSAVEQARELVRAMHERGVVHGDLGHDCTRVFGRDTNLILSPQGRLYVIDFASAMWRDRFSAGLYRTFEAHDRLVVTKLLRHFFAERKDSPEFERHLQLPPRMRMVLQFFKKL
jgi:predicted Ser/Thr protein kinase